MARRISKPAPGREHQRDDAHDERQRRHQNRAQPDAAGLEHRVDVRSPFRLAFLRELDD
jgi:hypothetical protein